MNNEEVVLKRDHEYYYQVQLQLFITEKEYCDFVVWANSDWFCERIYLDNHFIFDCISKALMFYEEAVLIEVLGKWFSRPRQGPTEEMGESVCHCGSDKFMDTLVICQSGHCIIGTYHLSCTSLKNPPKRKWICHDCRSLQKSQSNKIPNAAV